MTKLASKFTKLAGGAAVAGLVATMATPAMARPDRVEIGAGEMIAGAVVLGGLGAILASSGGSRDSDYRYGDGRYDSDRRYDRQGSYYGGGYRSGRQAVAQCVNAVERGAGLRRSRINVTEIRDIDRTRYGYRIRGTVEAEQYRRGHRDRYDRGRFTCQIDRGRVVDIDITGLDYRRRNW